MGKRLDPKEKVKRFIERSYANEVDKWNAGLSNAKYEWEDFKDYFELIDDLEEYIAANSILRNHNEILRNRIEHLEKHSIDQLEEIQELKRQLEEQKNDNIR